MKAMIKNGMLLSVLFVSSTASAAWDGVIDWARRTELSTPTSGIVSRVLVRAGERVKEKTVLLQLEQDVLRARVEQARAAEKHGLLMYEEAQREMDRSQELYDRTLLADHDLNLAKLAFTEADAIYQRAKADVLAAQEALAESELQAPFEALILERRVQPAQTVVHQLQAEPMLVIVSAKERLVRFTVQRDETAKLMPGTKVNVECQGQRYQGMVESLNLDGSGSYSSSSGAGHTVEVLFSTDAGLFPGTKASVSLP